MSTRPRWSVALRLAVVVCTVGLIIACTTTPKSGAWFGNPTDLARAQAIWTDPWAAPTTTKVAQYESAQSGVLDRTVGKRVTDSTGGTARARVSDEVSAALTSGWQLVGVACTTVGSGGSAAGGTVEPTHVEALLQRASGEIDRAATATVQSARAVDGGATIYTTVTVTVPHHLDTWWPRAVATPPEATCLGTGPSVDVKQPLRQGPWTDHGPVDPAKIPSLDAPTWSTPLVTDALSEAIRTAATDPWLRQLTLAPALPAQAALSDEVRASASATAPSGTTLGLLADIVTSALPSWRITYAACFGDAGPATAELTRDVGEGRWVTMRLGGRGGDRLVTRASSVISTPSLSTAPGATVREPCFSGSFSGTSGAETFRVDGIPAFGPTSTQPMLAST